VEMLIVVAIIIFLASAGLISSFAMRDQIRFRGGYNSLKGIIGEARSMALSGQSFPDTSDYDGDGVWNEDDLILPNGYIVQLFDDGLNIVVLIYADLFGSALGELDPPNDQRIKMIEIPANIRLTVEAINKSGGVIDLTDTGNITFMYKTPDAAFSVINNPEVQIMSLNLKLDQTDENYEESIKRTKYIFLHYLYGIPELLDKKL